MKLFNNALALATQFINQVPVHTVTSQYHFPEDTQIVERTESQLAVVLVAVRFPLLNVVFGHLSDGFNVAYIFAILYKVRY